jgi:transcriptional regulator with XRE-family HTH domain
MDTKKITSDLLSSGLTQRQLADLVPCSQSTIAAFINGTRGSNPTYVIATRLLALHAERCGVATNGTTTITTNLSNSEG